MPVLVLQEGERYTLQLAAVHAESFVEVERWSAQTFSQLLNMSNVSLCIHFQEENRIQGFILYSVVLDEAEILTIAVSPSWRRQKVGSELMGKLVHNLKCQAVRALFLEVCYTNQTAIAFYQYWGFEILGQRLDYYGKGNHALRMSKSII